ncbi:MAG TPA: sugar phosphate isomerase/epimerase [Cyclobacteriaceae bacterium]|nr:sugar phosphate isomerase/epimerase [Cyclobacteriaceae bacterium]
MTTINRRDFLKRSAALTAGSFVVPQLLNGNPYKGEIKKIGVQLFSIPHLVEKDFAGTMSSLAKTGYKEIEFYGPYDFSAKADIDGWKSVTPSLGFSGSGFYGLSVKEVKKILSDNGLSASSLHTGMATLHDTNALGRLADAANELGAKYVVLPSAPTQPDIDSYKKQADDFTGIGKNAKRSGTRFAYHNHGNGLKAINNIVPLELILESTDADTVFFQMDIYWMTAGGVDVVKYLEKYKGRFRLMHIKDMSKAVRFAGDGGDSKQWIDLFPYLSNAGSGVLDLKSILSAAKKSGMEHFIVERDLAPDGIEDLAKSYEYLSKLNVTD